MAEVGAFMCGRACGRGGLAAAFYRLALALPSTLARSSLIASTCDPPISTYRLARHGRENGCEPVSPFTATRFGMRNHEIASRKFFRQRRANP